jgi:hypothetical protein
LGNRLLDFKAIFVLCSQLRVEFRPICGERLKRVVPFGVRQFPTGAMGTPRNF